MVKKYGIPMLVTSDESLKEYLSTVLSQVQGELGLNATSDGWEGHGPHPSPFAQPHIPLALSCAPR